MKQVQKVNLVSKAVVDLFIYAQSAESSSILGIVLGNFGLNLNNFSNDFNNYTKELAAYFLLKVRIVVFENRTFSFSCTLASFGYFLKLLAVEREPLLVKTKRLHKTIFLGVYLNDVLTLARLKFPQSALKKCFPMLFSVVKSCDLKLLLL